MLKAVTYNIFRIFIFPRSFLRNCNKKFTIVLPVAENRALFFGNFSSGRQLDEFSSFLSLFHVSGIQLTLESVFSAVLFIITRRNN